MMRISASKLGINKFTQYLNKLPEEFDTIIWDASPFFYLFSDMFKTLLDTLQYVYREKGLRGEEAKKRIIDNFLKRLDLRVISTIVFEYCSIIPCSTLDVVLKEIAKEMTFFEEISILIKKQPFLHPHFKSKLGRYYISFLEQYMKIIGRRVFKTPEELEEILLEVFSSVGFILFKRNDFTIEKRLYEYAFKILGKDADAVLFSIGVRNKNFIIFTFDDKLASLIDANGGNVISH